MIIREAFDSDAEAIASIYNESIVAGDSTMDQTTKDASYVRHLLSGFRHGETILVLETDEGILGWGIVKRYSEREGYRSACETSVYLRRTEVRKGLGSRLQDALLDRCRQFGYHHVVAKIWTRNEASIEMHRKSGFQIVGIQKEIGVANGGWIDVAILQHILNPS